MTLLFTIFWGTVLEMKPRSANDRLECGAGVRDYNQADEQVPKQGHQVHGQEQDKEQRLQFWII